VAAAFESAANAVNPAGVKPAIAPAASGVFKKSRLFIVFSVVVDGIVPSGNCLRAKSKPHFQQKAIQINRHPQVIVGRAGAGMAEHLQTGREFDSLPGAGGNPGQTNFLGTAREPD